MRSCPEVVCGGVGRDKSVLQAGTRRSREVSARIGVTSDEAENAPRLRVANGEDSHESKPPVKRRAETHTGGTQDSSTPVPERWRSRAARIWESYRPEGSNRPGTRRTAVGKAEVAHRRRSSSSCFAERAPHHLTCQPPWRERSGANQPGSPPRCEIAQVMFVRHRPRPPAHHRGPHPR